VTDRPADGGDNIWDRLRRRKVAQWGIAYAAGSSGFLHGLSYLSTVFARSPQLQRFATVAFLVGLPIALALAWYHGDRGHQRVSGREFAILTALLVGGGMFWWVGWMPVATPATTMAAGGSAALANLPTGRVLPVLPDEDGGSIPLFIVPGARFVDVHPGACNLKPRCNISYP
jgi:fatty acid desaturase